MPKKKLPTSTAPAVRLPDAETHTAIVRLSAKLAAERSEVVTLGEAVKIAVREAIDRRMAKERV